MPLRMINLTAHDQIEEGERRSATLSGMPDRSGKKSFFFDQVTLRRFSLQRMVIGTGCVELDGDCRV